VKHVAVFFAGALFAAGLCISGMTSPARIIGFLDVLRWDPTLLFVMLGAVPVMFAAWRLRARMGAPIAAAAFPDPPPAKLDGRLFAGAALFGAGWGLGGFCPGPAVVSLGGGVEAALVLVPSMLAGMLLFRVFERATRRPSAGEERLPASPAVHGVVLDDDRLGS
jgi:uncharacterized membrane protein YedE/YeeE